ncbi:uncharacterized protein [Haliotis asinina]|uniref:uncharacterized protein n=1 Tax=Haliotis asinina TaxID=109174 RepID=UPI0035323FBB
MITKSHTVSHHTYADDTQLLKAFHLSDLSTSLHCLAKCTQDIKCWMTTNMLKLNDTKTEAVLVGTKQQLNKVKTDFLKVADADIKFSDVVTDLGVYIDSSLTLDSHVNHLSRICYFHLKSIGNIRQYLTTAATEALVRALVTSRLDYCNSILSGLSSTLLEKLQKIQNTSARIISKTSKRSRITPVLQDLHWLPVKARTDFKILCLI